MGRRLGATEREEGGSAVPAQSFKTVRRPRLAPQPDCLSSRQRPVSRGLAREARAGSGGLRAAGDGAAGSPAPARTGPREVPAIGGGQGGAEAPPCRKSTVPLPDCEGADFPPAPSSLGTPNSTSPPPDCFLRLLRRGGREKFGEESGRLPSPPPAPLPGFSESRAALLSSCEGPRRLGARTPPHGARGTRCALAGSLGPLSAPAAAPLRPPSAGSNCLRLDEWRSWRHCLHDACLLSTPVGLGGLRGPHPWVRRRGSLELVYRRTIHSPQIQRPKYTPGRP